MKTLFYLPFVAVFTFVLASCDSKVSESSEDILEIHFMDWFSTSPYRLNKDALINYSELSMVETNKKDIEYILSVLKSGEYVINIDEIENVDGRFYFSHKQNGLEYETYFGGKFTTCMIKKGVCKKNDEEFRSRVSKFMERYE